MPRAPGPRYGRCAPAALRPGLRRRRRRHGVSRPDVRPRRAGGRLRPAHGRHQALPAADPRAGTRSPSAPSAWRLPSAGSAERPGAQPIRDTANTGFVRQFRQSAGRRFRGGRPRRSAPLQASPPNDRTTPSEDPGSCGHETNPPEREMPRRAGDQGNVALSRSASFFFDTVKMAVQHCSFSLTSCTVTFGFWAKKPGPAAWAAAGQHRCRPRAPSTGRPRRA